MHFAPERQFPTSDFGDLGRCLWKRTLSLPWGFLDLGNESFGFLKFSPHIFFTRILWLSSDWFVVLYGQSNSVKNI